MSRPFASELSLRLSQAAKLAALTTLFRSGFGLGKRGLEVEHRPHLGFDGEKPRNLLVAEEAAKHRMVER